jgi:hypothetical protein
MINKNYKLIWMLDAMQSPESIPLYRFFLENDFNLEQHDTLMNLICYYEILLSGNALSEEKFTMLIRPKIRAVCAKKIEDITLENINLCISKMKEALLFEFDESTLKSVKGFAPNVYKALKTTK